MDMPSMQSVHAGWKPQTSGLGQPLVMTPSLHPMQAEVGAGVGVLDWKSQIVGSGQFGIGIPLMQLLH